MRWDSSGCGSSHVRDISRLSEEKEETEEAVIQLASN